MKKIILTILLFGFYNCLAQSKTILISNRDTTIQKMFSSSKKTLKDKVLKEIAIIQLEDDHANKVNYESDVTPTYGDTVITLTSEYCNYKVLSVKLKYYFDKIAEGGSRKFIKGYNKDSLQKYIDSSKIQIDGVTTDISSGGTRAVEKQFAILRYYESAEFSPIDCTINSIPKGISADVYLVSRKDWEDKYHFPSPPVDNVINKPLIQKIFYKRIGNTAATVLTVAYDEPYILIFDHNGIYTLTPLEPAKNKNFSYPIK